MRAEAEAARERRVEDGIEPKRAHRVDHGQLLGDAPRQPQLVHALDLGDDHEEAVELLELGQLVRDGEAEGGDDEHTGLACREVLQQRQQLVHACGARSNHTSLKAGPVEADSTLWRAPRPHQKAAQRRVYGAHDGAGLVRLRTTEILCDDRSSSRACRSQKFVSAFSDGFSNFAACRSRSPPNRSSSKHSHGQVSRQTWESEFLIGARDGPRVAEMNGVDSRVD